MDPLEIFGRSVRNLTHQADTQKSSNTQLLINVELLCNPYVKSTQNGQPTKSVLKINQNYRYQNE